MFQIRPFFFALLLLGGILPVGDSGHLPDCKPNYDHKRGNEYGRIKQNEWYLFMLYEDPIPIQYAPVDIFFWNNNDPPDRHESRSKNKRRHETTNKRTRERPPEEILAETIKEALHVIADVIGDKISDAILSWTSWFTGPFSARFGSFYEWGEEEHVIPPT